MNPTLRLPKEMLDAEAYEHLSPKDKSLYMEKALQEILNLNSDSGISISQIIESTYFDRKAISKYLEKLVARRVAYKVQQGTTIIYNINGRLIHHLFQKTVPIGQRSYSFKALFDGNQVLLFIQEIKKNELGIIEEGGGILIPLKDIEEFSGYVNKVKKEFPLIREKLMEMIE